MKLIDRLLIWLNKLLFAKSDARLIADFEASFPGRCIICSHHQFGIEHGYENPQALVRAHYCIEQTQGESDASL